MKVDDFGFVVVIGGVLWGVVHVNVGDFGFIVYVCYRLGDLLRDGA